MCSTRLGCTSEDECKWFFTTIWFILLKQIIKIRHCSQLQLLSWKIAVVHNITYSVHDEVLMPHRAHLVVLLAPPWTSCHSLCCRLTAYLTPHWVSQVPPPPPHSWWPHFPQGPRTPPSPCPLKITISRKVFSQTLTMADWTTADHVGHVVCPPYLSHLSLKPILVPSAKERLAYCPCLLVYFIPIYHCRRKHVYWFGGLL
jgi:hypothetical protein